METVAERIREARRKALLTQVELAERSGIPVVTISRLENGHREPRARTVRKLAAALGVDASWLMFGENR